MQQQRHEFPLFMLAALVGAALIISLPTSYPLPVRVAAAGGFVAAVGVVLIARPVWRVGVYTWIAERHFRDIAPESVSRRTKNDLLDDEFAQNILGPMLVGIGTIMNGFSGFA